MQFRAWSMTLSQRIPTQPSLTLPCMACPVSCALFIPNMHTEHSVPTTGVAKSFTILSSALQPFVQMPVVSLRGSHVHIFKLIFFETILLKIC